MRSRRISPRLCDETSGPEALDRRILPGERSGPPGATFGTIRVVTDWPLHPAAILPLAALGAADLAWQLAMLIGLVALMAVAGIALWRLRKRHSDLSTDLEAVAAERRRAVKALRETEVFYHSLVETLPQHILRKDLDGRFTFANQRFCAELGAVSRRFWARPILISGRASSPRNTAATIGRSSKAARCWMSSKSTSRPRERLCTSRS